MRRPIGQFNYYLSREIGDVEVVCDVVLTWSPRPEGGQLLEDVDVDPETILEDGEMPRDPHAAAALIEEWIFENAEEILLAAAEYCDEVRHA